MADERLSMAALARRIDKLESGHAEIRASVHALSIAVEALQKSLIEIVKTLAVLNEKITHFRDIEVKVDQIWDVAQGFQFIGLGARWVLALGASGAAIWASFKSGLMDP